MVRRPIFDTLRRGLDNAVANWGLIVIRVVEVIVFVAIAAVAVLAVVIPLLVSVGIAVNDLDYRNVEDVEQLLLTLLSRWVWLLWIFLGVTVLLLVWMAAHSFVEAGCARVAVDADRNAGPELEGPRSRYRVFSMARWLAGGKDGWWTVFWIYNFAWGVAGLIILLPLIPTALLMFFNRETPAVLILSGCIGIAVTLLLTIVVGFVTSMWTARATAEWAVDRASASVSLSNAWAAIKADVGRHVVILIVVIVIAMAGSSFFSTFSYFAAFGEMFHRGAMVQVFTIPLRVVGALLNWAFSAFVSSWYLAAFAALAVEQRKP